MNLCGQTNFAELVVVESRTFSGTYCDSLSRRRSDWDADERKWYLRAMCRGPILLSQMCLGSSVPQTWFEGLDGKNVRITVEVLSDEP